MIAPTPTQACDRIPPEAFAGKDAAIASHPPFAKLHFPKRMSEFALAPLTCHQIVMLGDSLTEANDWRALAPGDIVRNRGIGGDTSDGVLVRLDEVIISQPRAVFLLIGTNDLWSKNAPEQTATNILSIAKQIASGSPGTIVFVQTVFPVGLDARFNVKVREINALLKAGSDTSVFTLLDTHALLAGADGALKTGYTYDGVHLTPEGNAVWSRLVADTLNEHDLVSGNR